MEKQQTAVEWLIYKLDIILPLDFEWDKLEKSFKQAKQMEKEHMKEAFKLLLKAHVDDDLIVFSNKILDETFEDYYNETFKK